MKKKLSKLKHLSLSLLNHPSEFKTFFHSMRGEDIYENRKHIRLAADWLLKSQEVDSDDGYSRGFYLYKQGWDKSYIETTGYIIPTMLEVAEYLENEVYFYSAQKAGEWLLEVQNSSGSFSDIDNDKELVFDTGQVLYGLIALYENPKTSIEDKEKYLKAIQRAAAWLYKVQDSDGSWSQYGYQSIGHSYYARVAYILYKAGIVCKNEEFKNSAVQAIDWTLKQQKENAFFDKLFFVEGQAPLLHTMIYVLEGLYDYFLLTNDKRVWSALLRNANKLKEINLSFDLLLCSQYDENFECVNNERCITGLAQWSNLAFQLFEKTGDEDFLECAKKTLYYLKSKQFKRDDNLMGSLPGSVPFWGEYAPFSAINWGVKFYIDAMMQYRSYEEDLISQSNSWIGSCFKSTPTVVNDAFSKTGERYLYFLKKYISESRYVLDLGCGEGKYIRYFNTLLKRDDIKGIDPYFYDDKNVKKGDVYSIAFNHSFDLIYTIEVLQHVKYIDDALKNIHVTLKNDGYLIICDRNPKSVIGLLKPLYEFLGKWMYPFDSAFSEKWYSIDNWKTMLENSGYHIEHIESFTSKTGKLGWMNRYNIIVARK